MGLTDAAMLLLSTLLTNSRDSRFSCLICTLMCFVGFKKKGHCDMTIFKSGPFDFFPPASKLTQSMLEIVTAINRTMLAR